MQLLTCTADTALMIWEMDVDSGIWVCVSRLGEMSVKSASTATPVDCGLLILLLKSTMFWQAVNWVFRVYKSDENGQSFESVHNWAVKDVHDIKWSVNGDYFTAF